MKLSKYFILAAASLSWLAGCKDDPELQTTDIGPEMTNVVVDEEAVYGGQVSFAATLNDALPLSTLKAQVLFDGDLVAEEVIRTKTNGTYEGTVTLPYYKNFPDGGDAELVIVAQNTHFGLTQQTFPLTVYYPHPDKIVYLLGGQEYDMLPTENAFEYAVTAEFPQKPKGYIRAIVDELDSEVTFGYDTAAGGIVAGSTDAIPFTNSTAGEYTISFNIRTFDGAPFTKLLFDGAEMTMIDSETYSVVATLSQNATYTLEGIAGFADWTLDADFFERGSEAGEVKFLPLGGLYKITADFAHSYLKAEAMKSATELATLNEDGSGAIWAIGGMEVGKPTLQNAASWNPEKGGLCLARVADKKYQITFVAGVSINAAKFDFKFFHQKSWGGEFGGSDISTTSDLVAINDSGNLGLAEGKTLDLGGIYRFTVDITGGNKAAVLTVEKIGEQELPAADLRIDGVAMTQTDADNYSIDLDLTQGQLLTLGGADAYTPAWINPDFFAEVSPSGIRFVPMNGKYRISANLTTRVIDARALKSDGSGPATLDDDGHGAIWFVGYGIGSPAAANEPGWNTDKAICVPEFASGIYKLTAQAGKEGSTTLGERFRLSGWSGKFYKDTSWGGLGAFTLAAGSETLLQVASDGNLEIASGAALEEGATYCLTVDVTGGNDSPVVSLVKE